MIIILKPYREVNYRMSQKYNKSFLVPIIIGLILISVGLFLKVPGGALTTYGGLDGVSTDGYYFGNRYSSIDEYVGGDAYNYIIGASLVGGKIAGTLATKAILIVGGALSFGLGIAFMYKTGNVKKDSSKPELKEDSSQQND